MSIIQAKSFLKWAGGKTQLLPAIVNQIPYQKDQKFIYIKPFIGSGAVLFWVLNNYNNIQQAVISDLNFDLINCYQVIKSNLPDLLLLLKETQQKYYLLLDNKEDKNNYYYSQRKLFNRRISDNTLQASLFIFLNKTCFNGLYRVNKNNHFNVPIGSYKKPLICNKKNLILVSKLLQKVEILHGDFEKTLSYAQKDTLFYLDPPYKPLTKTSNFNSYCHSQFNDNEQIRLKRFCDRLDKLNYKWILSNSDLKSVNPEDNFFDHLYQDYQIERVLARRNINSNASKRGELKELLISNQKKIRDSAKQKHH